MPLSEESTHELAARVHCSRQSCSWCRELGWHLPNPDSPILLQCQFDCCWKTTRLVETRTFQVRIRNQGKRDLEENLYKRLPCQWIQRDVAPKPQPLPPQASQTHPARQLRTWHRQPDLLRWSVGEPKGSQNCVSTPCGRDFAHSHQVQTASATHPQECVSESRSSSAAAKTGWSQAGHVEQPAEPCQTGQRKMGVVDKRFARTASTVASHATGNRQLRAKHQMASSAVQTAAKTVHSMARPAGSALWQCQRVLDPSQADRLGWR
mmetsp:Transcript_74202/g.176762  ORF Transcript_74202/g.176762 Transcript_74202/m.176762 type:complete len:265 (-) Transcript_74202:491-1285(-)